jgi:hypothetical protein
MRSRRTAAWTPLPLRPGPGRPRAHPHGPHGPPIFKILPRQDRRAGVPARLSSPVGPESPTDLRIFFAGVIVHLGPLGVCSMTTDGRPHRDDRRRDDARRPTDPPASRPRPHACAPIKPPVPPRYPLKFLSLYNASGLQFRRRTYGENREKNRPKSFRPFPIKFPKDSRKSCALWGRSRSSGGDWGDCKGRAAGRSSRRSLSSGGFRAAFPRIRPGPGHRPGSVRPSPSGLPEQTLNAPRDR